ncbi:MAG: tetratricopeptide repeat protein [Alphaproteobacteria bacterium]|nr:tetratricopeptide repeat protein [Alphaproteobacteria bacterium]
MIRTIIFVVLAALVVVGAVWLAEHPGSVSFAWGDVRGEIEMPAVFGGLVLFAIVIALLYRVWWSARRVPKAISNSRQRGRHERGYKALTQGMVAVAAGDPNEARRQAQKADLLLGDPPLTMLLSAQAAQLNGDEAAASRYFNAMLKRPETAFLGLRGLLMQAERDGDNQAALEYADRAKTLQPKTPWVLTKLFDLQVRQGQWQAALKTLDQAIKSDAVEAADGQGLRAAILLGCSFEAETAGNKTAALSFAEKAHKQHPRHLPAIVRRASLMHETGKERGLPKLIKEAWVHSPHPMLASLYVGGDDTPDALTRVKKFEELREVNPDDPESRIALVQALIDAKIWGAAHTHLKALDVGEHDNPPSRVCRLMAELEEGENQNSDAVRYWLVRAASAAPDPAWICSDCGAATASWTPRCSRCAGYACMAGPGTRSGIGECAYFSTCFDDT